MFASCRDYPSYLASANTVRNLLLPAETVVLGKQLPAESVHVVSLLAETLSRKQNHTDSLCRKPFFVDGSIGRKQEITDSLYEAKYDGPSLQETKISGPVYTQCILTTKNFLLTTCQACVR